MTDFQREILKTRELVSFHYEKSDVKIEGIEEELNGQIHHTLLINLYFDYYFDTSLINVEEIKEFLLSEFSNVSISYLELLESIISECKYIEPDIKKALKILENENKIAVTRITSKTNRGLSGEDLIQFIG